MPQDCQRKMLLSRPNPRAGSTLLARAVGLDFVRLLC